MIVSQLKEEYHELGLDDEFRSSHNKERILNKLVSSAQVDIRPNAVLCTVQKGKHEKMVECSICKLWYHCDCYVASAKLKKMGHANQRATCGSCYIGSRRNENFGNTHVGDRVLCYS